MQLCGESGLIASIEKNYYWYPPIVKHRNGEPIKCLRGKELLTPHPGHFLNDTVDTFREFSQVQGGGGRQLDMGHVFFTWKTQKTQGLKRSKVTNK